MTDKDDISLAADLQTWLQRANLVAFGTIAAVAIFGQMVLAQLQSPFPENNARMRVAASQAVRAQSISHVAQALAAARAPSDLYTLRTDLTLELRRFVDAHRGLAYGDADMGLSGGMSDQARLLFFDPEKGLDKLVRDIEKSVTLDLLGEEIYVQKQTVETLSKTIRFQFNPGVEALIEQFAADARFGTQVSVAARIAIISVLLLAMLTVGQLLYRPLYGRIRDRLLGKDTAAGKLYQQHDSLTGLPNRTYLRGFLSELCKVTRDHKLRNAVLHVDLKDWAGVKDDAGMDVADEMLCMAARRIESVCRSGDFIARVGGDEFVIVAAALEDDVALNDLIDSLRTKLVMPFHIENTDYKSGCNIGIAFMDQNDRSADVVLSHAEAALREARSSDQFDTQFYMPNMQSIVDSRLHLRDELETAMKEGQLHAHFQPILSHETGHLVGLEALVRWHHPTKGLLTPIHFMEVAQAYEMMTDLTRVIMAESLNALKSWDELGIDVPFVAVNLDGTLLRDDSLIKDVKWTVDSHDLNAQRIAFEIPERAFEVEDSKDIATQIRLLAEYGFQVMIDDFGTGHLDASQLRRLAISTVKIDRAFVTNVNSDPEQQAIASAMIQHAHKSNLVAIAEGVENHSERLMLQRLGCDAFQGFHVAEPLSFDVMTRWLENYINSVNDNRMSA